MEQKSVTGDGIRANGPGERGSTDSRHSAKALSL